MTSDGRRADDDLRRQNAALNEQLKQLVRSDRQLSLSRWALADQLRRVHLLDAYALAASAASSSTEIMRLGLELLTQLFPYEQAVALVVSRGALVGAVSHAVAGMDDVGTVAADLPPVPVSPSWSDRGALLLAVDDFAGADADTRAVLGALDVCYPDLETKREHMVALVLPLFRRPGELLGVLVARRLARAQPFHEALPSALERDVLELAGKHVATAAANAALVEDLRKSYADLAAAQAGLVEKERLAALGEMSAQIAHEVRNPLGAIFNSLSRLKAVVHPGDEPDLLLRILGEEAARLARMVDDLLNFARPQLPEFCPERLNGVVSNAVGAVGRATDLTRFDVQVRCDADEDEIMLDARMIEQVVMNLVLNAAQAMPGRGRLTVRTSNAQRGGTRIACIDVVDSGCGVRADIAARLFQPFFTTRATGTGLGLALVKRFVDAHQGEVSFHSAGTGGATFRVELPERSPGDDERARAGRRSSGPASDVP